MTREEAVSFIQGTLGCDCPDDVLCAVSRETRDNPDICWHLASLTEPAVEAHSSTMMAVGGRLLVVVCPGLPMEELGEALMGAARLRDAFGFNRVRLVVERDPEHVFREMDSFQMPDERVHLHLLHRN